jgi:hypothetical protein
VAVNGRGDRRRHGALYGLTNLDGSNSGKFTKFVEVNPGPRLWVLASGVLLVLDADGATLFCASRFASPDVASPGLTHRGFSLPIGAMRQWRASTKLWPRSARTLFLE